MRAGQKLLPAVALDFKVLFAKIYSDMCNPAHSIRVCDGIKKCSIEYFI